MPIEQAIMTHYVCVRWPHTFRARAETRHSLVTTDAMRDQIEFMQS